MPSLFDSTNFKQEKRIVDDLLDELRNLIHGANLLEHAKDRLVRLHESTTWLPGYNHQANGSPADRARAEAVAVTIRSSIAFQ